MSGGDGQPVNISHQEALRIYPELSELLTLREAGWVFLPRLDNDGQLVLLDGILLRTSHTDAIRIAGPTDVLGLRLLSAAPGAHGGIVWQRQGSLTEVVRELLALPEPGHHLSPSFVRGVAPNLSTPPYPPR